MDVGSNAYFIFRYLLCGYHSAFFNKSIHRNEYNGCFYQKGYCFKVMSWVLLKNLFKGIVSFYKYAGQLFYWLINVLLKAKHIRLPYLRLTIQLHWKKKWKRKGKILQWIIYGKSKSKHPAIVLTSIPAQISFFHLYFSCFTFAA